MPSAANGPGAVSGAGSPGTRPASLLGLATPMIVSRAGLAAMAIVDSVMVAQYGAGHLATTLLAEGTFGRFVDMSLAFLLSGLVLVAAATASDTPGRRIAIWQRSVGVAAMLGLAGLVLSLFAEPILVALGQDAALAADTAPVILTLGLGLPAGLIAIASAVTLEGAGRAGVVARWIVVANLVNLGLNWVLIGGRFGMPELGALGAAVSTSSVRLCLAIALVLGVGAMDGNAFRLGRMDRRDAGAQWKLGTTALGAALGMHALGIWLTLFAGWLGTGELAVYAFLWILNLPGLLLAMGMSDAISVRVARAGALEVPRAQLIGQLGRDLSQLVSWLAPFVLVLCLGATPVSQLLSGDVSTRAMLAALLPISGLVLLLDGLSHGAIAALRGDKDIAVPMAIQVACMAATPPLAALLAFTLGLGVNGLVWAILYTSSLRLVILFIRLLFRFGVVPPPMPGPTKELSLS